MVSKKFAAEQIARLAQLEFFPRGDKAVLQDLVCALQCAASDIEARSVIDGYVETGVSGTKCPTAADIRRAVFAREHEEPEYKFPYEPPTDLCPRCRGLGNVQGAEGRYERCDCENGRDYPQALLDLANSPRKRAEAVKRIHTDVKLRQIYQDKSA